MHIGMVAPEYPPEIGGMQTYAGEVSRELARRGHRVTVFTRAHAEGEIAINGVEVRAELRSRRRLDGPLLRGQDVDVWHVMNAAYAWLALETAPVVLTVHGNDFLDPYILVERLDFHRSPLMWRWSQKLEPLDRWIGRRLTARTVRKGLARAAHVMTNSRYTERILLEHYPDCAGKTSPAMAGVGEDYFSRHETTAGNAIPRLLTICRLSEPRKNVDLVLRALARLKDHYDFHYEVIGDGPIRADLESLSVKLGIRDRVHFAGFVDHATLKTQLARADLFILASSVIPGSHEGLGLVYLEAAACGTPSLAARLGGAVEAVEDGVTGYFVEEPTETEIADAVKTFLAGDRKFDSTACRDFARGFTWRRVVDHALAVYANLGVA